MDRCSPGVYHRAVYTSTAHTAAPSSALPFSGTGLASLHCSRTGKLEPYTSARRTASFRLQSQKPLCGCRVPLNKQERKQLKTARRGGMAGGALLDDFADEIGHLVQVSSDDSL